MVPGDGHAAQAPQHALDARHQFARVEGLGDVVVGAHFEAGHALVLAGHGAEQDHRRGAVLGQVAAQRQAVFAGQHDVEHHQVDLLAAQDDAGGGGVGSGQDFEIVAAQEGGQRVADIGVVVDHQDAGGCLLCVLIHC